MEKKSPYTTAGITVGELRVQLQSFSDAAQLFMGGLRFNRLKQRSHDLVQLEFVEQVYRTDSGELIVEDI